MNSTYTLVVDTSGTQSGYLNAWFDLNADGDFDDANEQIATNATAATLGGTITLSVTIPATTPTGFTYARFRYSTQDDLPSADDYLVGEEAIDGEVEDYKVELIAGGDIQVTKSASPDPVASGENFTYTLTVKNNGPGTATGVVVTDTLPSGVTCVSPPPLRHLNSHTPSCVFGFRRPRALLRDKLEPAVAATANMTVVCDSQLRKIP